MIGSARGTLRRLLGWLGVVTVGVGAAACDETFAPLAPTELQFSIFGYLDVAADTQWIRVMPIRPLILTTREPLQAEVRIEEVGSGRVITLRDSVFRFDPDPALGSEGAFVHNFWAAERLIPEESYRLVVTRPGVEESRAEVVLPKKLEPAVYISRGFRERSGILSVENVPHLPFAILETFAYDRCSPRFVRHFLATEGEGEMNRLINLNVDLGLESDIGCQPLVIERQEIFLMASGARWPREATLSAGALNVPDSPSNISNAIGYLGGVATRRIPYEECLHEPEGFQPCRLDYGPASASIRGTVTDARCTRLGIVGAEVVLRELGPPRPEGRRVRPVDTYRDGGYLIAALETGREYELRVSRPGLLDPYERYHVHTDTLVFEAGEERVYDVGLQRLDCPPV